MIYNIFALLEWKINVRFNNFKLREISCYYWLDSYFLISEALQRKVYNNLIAAKRFKVRINFRRSFSQISRFLFLSRAISHQPPQSRHRSKRQRWLWRLSLVTWFLSTSGASQESKYFFKFLIVTSKKRSKSINTPQEQKTICYLREWRSFCNICLFSIKSRKKPKILVWKYLVKT